MKKIQPFPVWVNGVTILANHLFMVLNNDNLRSQATFYWCFYNQLDANNFGNKITEGNLTMTGADYNNFNSSNNANDYAYNWLANKLGVTIIP